MCSQSCVSIWPFFPVLISKFGLFVLSLWSLLPCFSCALVLSTVEECRALSSHMASCSWVSVLLLLHDPTITFSWQSDIAGQLSVPSVQSQVGEGLEKPGLVGGPFLWLEGVRRRRDERRWPFMSLPFQTILWFYDNSLTIPAKAPVALALFH